MLSSKLKKIKKNIQTIHYSRRLPSRIAILITVPRSGSTWLSDALRCHPCIEYIERNTIYKQLGIRGRRYPSDLCNVPGAQQFIEVTPYVWDKIQRFDVPGDFGLNEMRSSFGQYAIEKIHPEYFDYDVSIFLSRVRSLQAKGVEFKFIYQVRDPIETFTSWLNYQIRNPAFNADIHDNILAEYMEQSYAAINKLTHENEGLVIDYSEMLIRPENVLFEMYNFLWPELSNVELEILTKTAKSGVIATGRSKRASLGSLFLGKKAGEPIKDIEKLNTFLEANQGDIKLCQDYYKSILGPKGI